MSYKLFGVSYYMSTLVKCAYINQDEMRMHKFEQSFLSQNKFQLYFWNLCQLFTSLWTFVYWRSLFSTCNPLGYGQQILPSYNVPTLYADGPDDNGCWFYSGNSTVPGSNTSGGLGSMSGFQCVRYGSQNNTWYNIQI